MPRCLFSASLPLSRSLSLARPLAYFCCLFSGQFFANGTTEWIVYTWKSIAYERNSIWCFKHFCVSAIYFFFFFSIFVERRGLLICEKEIFCIPADIYFHSYESHAELRIEMRQRRVKEREREERQLKHTIWPRCMARWKKEKLFSKCTLCLRGLIHAFFYICKVLGVKLNRIIASLHPYDSCRCYCLPPQSNGSVSVHLNEMAVWGNGRATEEAFTCLPGKLQVLECLKCKWTSCN